MSFTLLIGYVSLGKGFDFSVYDSVSGDDFSAFVYIKRIQENGFMGTLFSDRIGAPDTAAFIDYPASAHTRGIMIWIISWFVKSTTAILYIFLIITFLTDGLGMSILLRKLEINRKISFVISSLFSFAPYHFYRYLGHSSLIEYAEIPLAILLALYITENIREKKWKIAVIAVILGFGYGYYYAFGLILLAVAYIIKFIRLEDKKKILKDAWVMLTVLAVILIGLMPKIVYSAINGKNTVAGVRSPIEQEIYGLKIVNMLLPVSYSRIETLRNLTAEYASKAPLVNENALASLGFIASIGFIILCAALIISFADKKKHNNEEWQLVDFLSLSVLVFVLMGAIGGFGEIFNWAVTAQIRCYNRSSIVITALSLVMVALLLNKIVLKKKVASYGICALVLLIGMFDQIKICAENWQDSIRPVQEMYEEYFSQVEDSLPSGAMVYQLPYMDYPEAGFVNDIGDYELFAGYLFTDSLKWSYGGVKGRNVTAKNLNIDNGMSFDFLMGLKKAGFSAVYIDTDGYIDQGQEILCFYNSLGIEPIVSSDDKMYVYNISDIEVSENMSVPGYSLCYVWANENSVTVDDKKLLEIAQGLSVGDISSIKEIYSWFIHNDVVANGTNEEYINWLYKKLLRRGADADGYALHLANLNNSANREDLFISFLCSKEFRNLQGF